MDKDFILSEIKRTAAENRGAALGSRRFSNVTGIMESDWFGVHWSKWGDALREAGCVPNEFQSAYEERYLLERLVDLIRDLGRFPVAAELRIKARNDKSFPSHGAFERLGSKRERAQKVFDYCAAHPGCDDVANLYRPLANAVETDRKEEPDKLVPFGYVYLARMGRHYKIGRTGSIGRREYELAIQLPEKLTLVHAITTDDPAGIEAYWHKRFEDQRGNGEWFELSAQDVRAFKRRTFM